MSDNGQQTATQAQAGGGKRGVPRGSLREAEALASGLWAAARLGSVPPEALARQLSGPDAKASGGAWRAKLALMRVFGLLDDQVEQGKLRLSDIGRGVVRTDDESARLSARRQAVMRVEPYAKLLAASAGQPLPPSSSLEATFEFEYGLASKDAKAAAEAFLESVVSAGFVEDGAVALSGEAVQNLEGGGPRDSQEAASASGSASSEPSTRNHDEPSLPFRATEPRQHSAAQPLGAATLQVSLDLSGFDAEEVVRILAVLGFCTSATETED